MPQRKRTLEMQADRIEMILDRHKVKARVNGGTVTPRYVRFDVAASAGTKVDKIKALAEEIALALGKREARIYRQAGGIHVEVPHDSPEAVRLLPLCQRIEHVPPVTAVLGVEQDGTPLLLRLPAPDVAHVLIAGTTGSGKTALARTLLTSLTMFNRQNDIQLILIDPKGRGFAPLSDLPHVLGQMATTSSSEVRGPIRSTLAAATTSCAVARRTTASSAASFSRCSTPSTIHFGPPRPDRLTRTDEHRHPRHRPEALEPLQRPQGRRRHVPPVRYRADLPALPQDGEGDGHRGPDP